MRSSRVAAVVFGVVVVALFARTARATPTARLVYVRGAGTESCPNEEAIARAVAARLGYDPFRPIADNTVFAEVRRGPDGFTADLKIVDDHGMVRGARHLTSTSDDCADVTHTMALSVSIALDPLSLTRPPLPAAAPSAEAHSVDPSASGGAPYSTRAPPPESPRPSAADEVPAPNPGAHAEEPHLAVHLGVGPLASFGTSPAPALGGAAFVGARYSDVSLDLGARADLPSSRTTEQGGAARTTLIAAFLAPCAHLGPAFACATGLVGSLATSAVSVSQPKSDSGFFAAAGPRVGTSVGISSVFSLRVYGDALFTLTPYSLRLNDKTVFSSSPVSVAVSLAGVLHFS